MWDYPKEMKGVNLLIFYRSQNKRMWKRSIYVFCLLGWSWGSTVHDVITKRLHTLRNTVHRVPSCHPCSTTHFLTINGGEWGRAGNQLIEFTHALWLAKTINATFLMPPWMPGIFGLLGTDQLHKKFCFTDRVDPNYLKSAKVIEIAASDAFYMHLLLDRKEYAGMFPKRTDQTASEVSKHFLQVYSSVWSSPGPDIISEAVRIIDSNLGQSLAYCAVHKRTLENSCNEVMNIVTKVTDFHDTGLPMQHDNWKSALANHPLCEMTPSFILDTIAYQNRSKDSKVFVSFDGIGSTDMYSSSLPGSFISNVLGGATKRDHSFLDLFLAMHSDLFIMNPRSTFSWIIFVVRAAMQLDSVPVMKNKDLFLSEKSDFLWVSWLSILSAARDFHQL